LDLKSSKLKGMSGKWSYDVVCVSLTERVMKTVEIELKKMEIEEKGIRLRLTIVDTPGFNDSLKGEER